MKPEDAIAAFDARLPDATVQFAFWHADVVPDFDDARLNLLYTYPNERHTGLLHWTDELAWYEQDLFVVAMECSKWLRLCMKQHPYAVQLLQSDELLRQSPWPPPVELSQAIETWLYPANRWLFELRGENR